MKRLYIFYGAGTLAAIFIALIFFLPAFSDTYFHAAAVRMYSKIKLALIPAGKADILLAVEFDKQDHALSCEFAVLKMALVFRGVNIDEAELIKKTGFDNTPKKMISGQMIWGDPQKGFVGNIDGKMLVDGYGVYWKPIAKTANQYRQSVWFEGWDISDLAVEIERGNPVIIWGYLGRGNTTSWQTSNGLKITGIYYEHSFLVNGLKGPVNNPEGFFLIDPIYGQIYYSKEEFLKKWNAFGRSGVVVY